MLMIATKQVEPTSLQTVDLSGRLCRTFEKNRLQLEDCATFEKKKCFHCYHFAEKTTSKSLSNAFVPEQQKKQFIPQISSQNLYIFWVSVLRKKCKPQFIQKVNSNLFIF